MRRCFLSIVCCIHALIAVAATASLAQPVAIALHGGAGTISRSDLTPDQEKAYLDILERAVDLGYERLERGADGIDVVVEVIQLLEDSPLFNAGRGAVLTWQGNHELDASIMDGATLNAGAVAGITTLRSPIAAARAVMEVSPHVMLAGAGAEEFAIEQGLDQVSNDWFTTERRVEALERYKAQSRAGLAAEPAAKFGTVGVVVLDSTGHLAAGTSTGGMTGKRWGRVGDAPIIGAGTYANDQSCAVSATGHGEFFIRWTVASDICARVRYQGLSLQQAASDVIVNTLLPVGGEGGVVAVDPEGNVAMVFNSEGMYRAAIDARGDKTLGIYAEQQDRSADNKGQ